MTPIIFFETVSFKLYLMKIVSGYICNKPAKSRYKNLLRNQGCQTGRPLLIGLLHHSGSWPRNGNLIIFCLTYSSLRSFAFICLKNWKLKLDLYIPSHFLWYQPADGASSSRWQDTRPVWGIGKMYLPIRKELLTFWGKPDQFMYINIFIQIYPYKCTVNWSKCSPDRNE